jgi:site-specific recombinase XerD
MRLQAAVDEYLAALRGRHAPPTTIKAYASDLRRFVNAAPAELSRIDAEAVRAFLEHESTLSPATRRRRHA